MKFLTSKKNIKLIFVSEKIILYVILYIIIASAFQYMIFNLFDKADFLGIAMAFLASPLSAASYYIGGCTHRVADQDICTYKFNVTYVLLFTLLYFILRFSRNFFFKVR